MKLYTRIRNFVFWLYGSHGLRLKLSLVGGIFLNFLYIAGNIVSAFVYGSIWSATLTIYHLTLVIIRVYLLSARGGAREIERADAVCLRVGVLMLFLDLITAYMMIYTLRIAAFVSYSGFILVGFVLYSAYSITTSLLAVRDHGQGRGRLHFVAKNITLSTSLMSVFNLQYSFLSILGASLSTIALAIFIGGVAVFSAILFMSLRLIRIGLGSSKI